MKLHEGEIVSDELHEERADLLREIKLLGDVLSKAQSDARAAHKAERRRLADEDPEFIAWRDERNRIVSKMKAERMELAREMEKATEALRRRHASVREIEVKVSEVAADSRAMSDDRAQYARARAAMMRAIAEGDAALMGALAAAQAEIREAMTPGRLMEGVGCA